MMCEPTDIPRLPDRVRAWATEREKYRKRKVRKLPQEPSKERLEDHGNQRR